MDERVKKLACNLVRQSCKVAAGEKVYIQYSSHEAEALVRQLVAEVYAAGGMPFVHCHDQRMLRAVLMNASEEQLRLMAEVDALEMSKMDCFISVRGAENGSELSDVPAEKMAMYDRLYGVPVHNDIRVPKTKWVVLRYPTPAQAQAMETSQDAFEDFFFQVCTMDYSRMLQAMQPLKELMERTDKVHIKGVGTDLTFSIKGIPAIPCAGEMNIPDGEVFTAPVRDSVNGVLTYNTPSVNGGYTFENIRLVFRDGRIVEATANNTEKINAIFDTDEGARYVGEFALGVNPYITKPMKNILFDEKIMGSFHFTPGNCYEEAPNGNRSAIHWDLVCIQTPEYGGGEIYFDDVLIRKDGRFVLPQLEALNPEALMDS